MSRSEQYYKLPPLNRFTSKKFRKRSLILSATRPIDSFFLLCRADIDAAVHGAAGAGRVDPRARHLRLVALHRLPRLQRLRPQPPRHQVSQAGSHQLIIEPETA